MIPRFSPSGSHRPNKYFITKPLHGVEYVAGINQLHRIDLMWRLFNAWPNTTPRLEKTQAATRRMDMRQENEHAIPPRWAFKSTADYYDAVMPYMVARRRFALYIKPSTFMNGVNKALQTLLPSHLR